VYKIATASLVTPGQASEASDALSVALGGALEPVQVRVGEVEVAVVGPGRMRARVGVEGLTSGLRLQGVVRLALGGVMVDTVDGEGSGVIEVGPGLRVVGEVGLVAGDGTLDVVFHEPRLVLEAEAPWGVRAAFEVELVEMQDGAGLEVVFSREMGDLVTDRDAVLALAAGQVATGGSVGSEDVAFAVRVVRRNLSNDSLGDNAVALTVGAEWVLERQAAGKGVAIVKVNDDGRVFGETASCEVDGETAVCEATFAGEASGFSTFLLVAVQPGPTPTATLAPTPTPNLVGATPTLTPTASEALATPTMGANAPTPTVAAATSDEGGGVGMVLVAMVAIGAAGAVAIMVAERGGTGRG
jgi:hypothetical protein